MTFGLEYFTSSNDFEELVSVIDRYCNLTRIELLNRLMNEIELIFDSKKLPDTETTMLAFFDLLKSWKQDAAMNLASSFINPVNFRDCLKIRLEKLEQQIVPT